MEARVVEYGNRTDRQDEFVERVVAPLLLKADIGAVRAYFSRTPEQKILDDQERSGLSAALWSLDNGYTENSDSVLLQMRHSMAIAELCRMHGIPLERRENGRLSSKTSDALFDKVSLSVHDGIFRKYGLRC